MQPKTNITNLKKDIQKILTSLRKKPFITENFWQKEINSLRDKYDIYNIEVHDLIQSLDNKLMDCTDPSSL